MNIAIAGNIGSGKTTLTKMLAAHYGWTPKFESVDYNPYLADFYEDMERWSFNLQVYFLNKRFKALVFGSVANAEKKRILISLRLKTLNYKRNALGLSKVATVNKYFFIKRKSVLFSYSITLF